MTRTSPAFCRHGRTKAGLAAFALATLAACALAGPASATSPAGFCEPTVLWDYLKPTERMPQLRSLERESPGFRPGGGVQIRGARESRHLQLGAGDAGYAVHLYSSVRRIDWLVTAKLATVDGDGDIRESLGSVQKRIRPRPVGSERAVHDFEFALEDRPEIYRIVLTIRNTAGEVLERLGKYVRVMRPDPEAAFVLGASSYRPGETVEGRIENYGNDWAQYGAEYGIERLNSWGWADAPESPRGFIAPLWGTGPGETGVHCSRFYIPATMPPGHYRMIKEFQFKTEMDELGYDQAREFVSAPEFDVVP